MTHTERKGFAPWYESLGVIKVRARVRARARVSAMARIKARSMAGAGATAGGTATDTASVMVRARARARVIVTVRVKVKVRSRLVSLGAQPLVSLASKEPPKYPPALVSRVYSMGMHSPTFCVSCHGKTPVIRGNPSEQAVAALVLNRLLNLMYPPLDFWAHLAWFRDRVRDRVRVRVKGRVRVRTSGPTSHGLGLGLGLGLGGGGYVPTTVTRLVRRDNRV